MHEGLRAGMTVEVRGPRNRFPLARLPAYVFVAGGIGITPILPMLRAVSARPGLEWRLLYGGRTRASMPYLAEIEKLGAGAGEGRVTVVAEDEDGLPDLDALFAGVAAELPEGTAVHCCGPEALMAAVEARIPEGAVLRLERFTPRTSSGGNQPSRSNSGAAGGR